MNRLQATYRTSLTLLTDLYQLTMAYGYWKTRTHNVRAAFHQYFRKSPFGGGYSIACGLSDVLDFLQGFRFDSSDVGYLATLEGNDGKPLFEPAFLTELAGLRL